jgi:hypothetical protein
MSADADAVDGKHINNNETDKLTNNHVDVWNVDNVSDRNNDSDDARSDRRDNVDGVEYIGRNNGQ